MSLSEYEDLFRQHAAVLDEINQLIDDDCHPTAIPIHPVTIIARKELVDAFKVKYPKIHNVDYHTPFKTKYLTETQEDRSRYQERLREYKNSLDMKLQNFRLKMIGLAASDDITVPQSDEWIELESIYSGAYSSQGFGADRYLQGALNKKIAEYARYGVECEIRGNSVWAKTTEIGKSILENKPPMPLKEVLRFYWKNGLNPRVYDPFLEPGLEAKLGLDYFGNDIVPQKA